MYFGEHEFLRWLHVLAMTYWLGGEWGVFNASRYVDRPDLPLDERMRHMETAYRIDIPARTGIILLLPLGLHMGYNLGVQPLGGGWLVAMWLIVTAWLSLTWSAFFTRGTDLGVRLTRIDEAIRYVLIPALLILGIWSLIRVDGPFAANWYAAKVALFGGLLIIGLILRFIMRDWVGAFRQLAEAGSTPEVEAKIHSSLQLGRRLAYVYWVGIATVAYLGVMKPF